MVDAVGIFQGIYKPELIEIVLNPLAFAQVIKWKALVEVELASQW